MDISSNYSIINLFANNKKVQIFSDDGIITLNLKSIRDFYNDSGWTTCYALITDEEKRRKILPSNYHSSDPLDEIKVLIFTFGKYDRYNNVVMMIREQLESLIDGLHFNFSTKELEVNDITITSDIWNYIIYVLKLSCGEKESLPPKFENEAARQLYLAQKQFEKQVSSIKNKGDNNEQLLRIMLTIIYEIPSFTFDYLFDLTMAQIHWLYNYAAKSVSYKVTAQAYAAGNLKKGKTPDFFIK